MVAATRAAIAGRVRRGYFLCGASGDLTLSRLDELLPTDAGLRIVGDDLLQRLANDAAFRERFESDVSWRQLSLGIDEKDSRAG